MLENIVKQAFDKELDILENNLIEMIEEIGFTVDKTDKKAIKKLSHKLRRKRITIQTIVKDDRKILMIEQDKKVLAYREVIRVATEKGIKFRTKILDAEKINELMSKA